MNVNYCEITPENFWETQENIKIMRCGNVVILSIKNAINRSREQSYICTIPDIYIPTKSMKTFTIGYDATDNKQVVFSIENGRVLIAGDMDFNRWYDLNHSYYIHTVYMI